MQTIAFRLIKGIMLLPADGGAVSAAVAAGFPGSAAAAGRIIECPNLTAVSGRIPAEKTHNTDKSAVSSGESSETQKKRFFARFSPPVEAVLFTGLAALRAVFGCPFRPDSALTRAAPVVYDGIRSCLADTICSMGRRKHPQLMPNERLVINWFSNGK